MMIDNTYTLQKCGATPCSRTLHSLLKLHAARGASGPTHSSITCDQKHIGCTLVAPGRMGVQCRWCTCLHQLYSAELTVRMEPKHSSATVAACAEAVSCSAV